MSKMPAVGSILRGVSTTGKREMLGNRRVTGKEQFYTPPTIADDVVQEVLSAFPSATAERWLEPAGGSGAFLDAFERAGVEKYWACDIEPCDSRVSEGNFLTTSFEPTPPWVTVTNPPFGRNNALSVPFFNHAAEFSQVIAFIVPRSWRKWSVSNRLDHRFHLVSDRDLAIDYVKADGSPISKRGSLKTCVQVWERRAELRPKVVVEDRGYIEKVKPDQADVSLTIFGHGCGTVKTAFERKPNTTQMFLRVTSPEVLAALETVDYARFFTRVAYTEALSIKEIFFLLNEYFDGTVGAPTATQNQLSF